MLSAATKILYFCCVCWNLMLPMRYVKAGARLFFYYLLCHFYALIVMHAAPTSPLQLIH